MLSVVGKLEDNDFLQELKLETEKFGEKLNVFFEEMFKLEKS